MGDGYRVVERELFFSPVYAFKISGHLSERAKNE